MAQCIALTKHNNQCRRKSSRGDYCFIHNSERRTDVDLFTYAYILGYRVAHEPVNVDVDPNLIPNVLSDKIKTMFTQNKELCPVCFDDHYLCIPSCHEKHGLCLSCFIRCQGTCPICKASVANYDIFLWIAERPVK